MAKKLDYFALLAGIEFIDTLPKNFRREALEPFAWELSASSGGAIYVHLSGKTLVLLLKHPNTGVCSLWWGDLPVLADLAREAGAPRLGPVRRLH